MCCLLLTYVFSLLEPSHLKNVHTHSWDTCRFMQIAIYSGLGCTLLYTNVL